MNLRKVAAPVFAAFGLLSATPSFSESSAPAVSQNNPDFHSNFHMDLNILKECQFATAMQWVFNSLNGVEDENTTKTFRLYSAYLISAIGENNLNQSMNEQTAQYKGEGIDPVAKIRSTSRRCATPAYITALKSSYTLFPENSI